MRKPVLFAALLPLVLAGFASPQEGKPKKAEKAAAPTVLVVNLQRVIDETAEGRQFVKKLNEEMAQEQKRLNEQAQKLQETVKELTQSQLNDRTKDFYEKFRKAMEDQAKLEMDKQIFLLQKGDEISRATNELIRGAQQEARAIMRERGAHVVLLSKMGPLAINNEKEWQQELVSRRVLVASDETDITTDVVARMNKWWDENKGGKAPPKREPEKTEKAKAAEEKAEKAAG